MERETLGLVLLRNWSNSSLGQTTWTKRFAWVRIKSKSIEERGKKKKKKKEEINQSNHILLLLTQETDTVAFFFSFPFSIKLVL